MAERRSPRRFFCTGTNRFGRPCTNRVERDGDECGRCRGVADLPNFDHPPQAPTEVPPPADDFVGEPSDERLLAHGPTSASRTNGIRRVVRAW